MLLPSNHVILLNGPYVCLELEIARGVARITRKSTPYATIEACEQVHMNVAAALDRVERRSIGVLYDSRSAPTINNYALEGVLRRVQRPMFRDVRRVAFLMRTVIGKVQAERLAAAEGISARAFLEEHEAIAYVQADRAGQARSIKLT